MNTLTKQFINSNNKFVVKNEIGLLWEGEFFKGVPNAIVNTRKTKTADSLLYPNELVYECTYKFNDFGLRDTICDEHNEVALFFGDSQTFGEGCNDEETLPSVYSKSTPVTSFNFGMPGYTLSHLKTIVDDYRFAIEFARAVGKAFIIYRDELTFTDTIKGADEITRQHYAQIAADIDYIKTALHKISPRLDFHVVMLPLSWSAYNLEPYLKNLKIQYTNLSLLDLEFFTKPHGSRFLDGAQTYASNKLITEYIKLGWNIPNPFDYAIYNDDELLNWIKFRSFFIPWMKDFPYDDYGIIVTQKMSEAKVHIPIDETLDIAKVSWKNKFIIIEELRKSEALPYLPYTYLYERNEDIQIIQKTDDVLNKYLSDEYADLFWLMYAQPFLINIM